MQQRTLALLSCNSSMIALDSVIIIDWAEPPDCDKESKILHWAKDARFGESEDNSLNYNLWSLGRKAVMLVNANDNISYYRRLELNESQLLSVVRFDIGYKYGNFNPSCGESASRIVHSYLNISRIL